MKRILIPIVFILVVVAIAAALFFMVQHKAKRQYGRPGMQGPAAITTARVVKKAIAQSIQSVGSVKAFEAITITSNVTEYVRKLHFDDGDFVKKGTLLVEFETREERALLDAAKAKFNEAQKQFKRTQTLVLKDHVSKAEHDKQIAELKSTKAKIAEMESRIRDRMLRAPYSGVLGFRKVSEGELVEPGNEIVSLDVVQPIKVDFNLPEKYLGRVKKGQTILATSVAFPKETFTGTVRTIASRVDEGSRSVVVRAIVPNKKALLRPGMHLTVELQLASAQVILIPEEALVPADGKQYVFVVNQDNTVQRVEVQLGQRVKGRVVITKGLQAGMVIVVDGGFKLRSGQKVRAHVAV